MRMAEVREYDCITVRGQSPMRCYPQFLTIRCTVRITQRIGIIQLTTTELLTCLNSPAPAP
jgi:hypothetical protein